MIGAADARPAGPEVDAVVIGAGWVGGIMAAELTKAGLEVVALERGPDRRTGGDDDGRRDDLLVRRGKYVQDMASETWTLRHDLREDALPMRQAIAFTPGTGVGGSSLLYGGHCLRLAPYDFEARTSVIERYGEAAIPQDSTLADWGIAYDELAPYYDRFEAMAGISGTAGNVNGEIRPGGNPFEGPRSSEFPLPPMRPAPATETFRQAAESVGFHPFPVPSATLPVDYTNPDGITRSACTYCGFCAGLPCTIGAKADASVTVLPVAERTGRFELRPHSYVVRILHEGGRATGVLYYDEHGELRHQPASIVVVSAYALNNTRLLLLSGLGAPYDPVTGEGVVGRHYAYNVLASSQGLFADRTFDGYVGSGATGYYVADFNADNFDHAGLGFIGGGTLVCATLSSAPLRGLPVPPGTPRWGAGWKRALRDWYDRGIGVLAHGEVLPYRQNHLDLDPVYRDAWGEPLLRMTFDWHENERRMYRFLRARAEEVVQAMGPDHVMSSEEELSEHFDSARYQSTHNTGGAIMGSDPSTSAVNSWMQMWDCENVWAVGGSAFPHSAGVGPTGTIGALAYRAADGIVSRYVKSPGPLA